MVPVAHTVMAAPVGSQAITMTPSSTDIKLDPGTSARRSFRIINGGDDAFLVKTSVSPYRVVGEEYDPAFSQLPGTVSPINWVKIEDSNNKIEPNQTSSVDYTVSVPKNAAPGGYYLVLFAQTSPVTSSTTGVVPHNRVGNVLYITVNGSVKTSGTASAAPLGGFYIQDNIPLGVKVSNDGGVHFVSKAAIDVKGLTGQQLYDASLERYVLPQTVRHIEAEWKPTAPIGLYTVSRSAVVAGQTQELPDTRILVVKPWFFYLIVILVVLVVLLVIVQRTRRSANKPHSKDVR